MHTPMFTAALFTTARTLISLLRSTHHYSNFLFNGLVQNWERSMSRLYIVTLLVYLIDRVYDMRYWSEWLASWNQDCWEKYK